MVNTVSNLISAYDLNVVTRNSNGYQFEDVRGTIDNRRIYICINFTSQVITWRDNSSKEEKMYRF